MNPRQVSLSSSTMLRDVTMLVHYQIPFLQAPLQASSISITSTKIHRHQLIFFRRCALRRLCWQALFKAHCSANTSGAWTNKCFTVVCLIHKGRNGSIASSPAEPAERPELLMAHPFLGSCSVVSQARPIRVPLQRWSLMQFQMPPVCSVIFSFILFRTFQ